MRLSAKLLLGHPQSQPAPPPPAGRNTWKTTLQGVSQIVKHDQRGLFQYQCRIQAIY
jgi:hypothetical protein